MSQELHYKPKVWDQPLDFEISPKTTNLLAPLEREGISPLEGLYHIFNNSININEINLLLHSICFTPW